MKAQASDAVDSALQLLYDLIQAEHDEQTHHDEVHAQEVIDGEAQIAYLLGVKNDIRAECDNGHEHLQFVLDEITDTQNHLLWIQGRVDTLHNQREQLEAARCESNAIFIQSIREHQDALDIIEWLRSDLVNWQNAESLGANFAQVTSLADKLKAYSHLFEKNALKEFLSLGDPKSWDELTDGTTRRDIDDAAVDNNRDALALDGFDSQTSDRNVAGTLAERISALLDKLEAHIKDSLVDLQTNEIKAAFDLADWLEHADDELAELAADAERKNKYLEKLGLDREIAQETVDACEVRYDNAVAAHQAAIDDLNAKNAWYASETQRRNDETALLQECITIFEDKVSSMKDYLRDRIEDYQPDQTFDQTDLRGVSF